MEILGAVQCYEWGKLGDSSLVAQLARANDSGLTVDPSRPYAELWMGDHVNGPATIKATGQSLTENIRTDPVGTIGGEKATSLPFLLKVLSIRKALSIQVHPDKPEAEKLHLQFPDVYKDPNHKPELAIALTDFQALCGFRPYPEILRLIEKWDPLQTLLGSEILARFRANPDRQAVQGAYEQLMRSEPEALNRCIDAIAERMRSAPAETNGELVELFLRLVTDFGHDVGVLSIFFLNVLRLKPGEAIYLAANVPHAYLDGDCVECMACSDNVVRAGLTPKFKDVETLLRLVSYECGPPAAMLARARLLREDKQPYTRTFVPPVPDFAVSEIRLPASATTGGAYTLDNPDTGSILLVAGSRKASLTTADGQHLADLKLGTVLFLPSSTSRTLHLKLTNDDNDDEPFLAFQAMANGFAANSP
ncbi:mannose-6-phosphate isomerase [Anopheles aquasalis]|uniref:mannose-6-phosphate isomerase n=1 Tax=Anopheles aquasalis TaxID=42839 RepID=UPI00215AB8D5|nr:mannose-6-phosphate isomerase [Anopheles aquasalis]